MCGRLPFGKSLFDVGASWSGAVMQPGLSPRTAETLDKLGVTIVPVEYEKVFLGGGGIHCSASPLVRDPVD